MSAASESDDSDHSHHAQSSGAIQSAHSGCGFDLHSSSQHGAPPTEGIPLESPTPAHTPTTSPSLTSASTFSTPQVTRPFESMCPSASWVYPFAGQQHFQQQYPHQPSSSYYNSHQPFHPPRHTSNQSSFSAGWSPARSQPVLTQPSPSTLTTSLQAKQAPPAESPKPQSPSELEDPFPELPNRPTGKLSGEKKLSAAEAAQAKWAAMTRKRLEEEGGVAAAAQAEEWKQKWREKETLQERLTELEAELEAACAERDQALGRVAQLEKLTHDMQENVFKQAEMIEKLQRAAVKEDSRSPTPIKSPVIELNGSAPPAKAAQSKFALEQLAKTVNQLNKEVHRLRSENTELVCAAGMGDI